MSIFGRSTMLASAPDLNDAPELWVPPHLAAFYGRALEHATRTCGRPQDDAFLQTNVLAAAAAAVERRHGTSRPGAGAFQDETTRLAAEIMESPRRLRDWFEHTAAIQIAERAHATAQDRAAREDKRRGESTCPICDECAPRVNGTIKFRALLAEGAPDVGIRSCAACYTVAASKHVASLAGFATADGRTRAARVAAALEKETR